MILDSLARIYRLVRGGIGLGLVIGGEAGSRLLLGPTKTISMASGKVQHCGL